MKLKKAILLMITALLCLSAKGNAAVLDANFISGQIKKDLVEQIKQKHDGKITVEVTALPFQTIEVPDGVVKIEAQADSGSLDSAIVKVAVYSDDIKVKTFGARVEINVYDRVWVAKDWIKRGETLKNLKQEERNISSMLNEVTCKDFVPAQYLVRRNIKPGEVINRDYIEEVPTIVKNSPVSLIFKTPQVSVTIPAIAMTSGKTGDFIKVKNRDYKKNYVGKIIGKNLVLVHI